MHSRPEVTRRRRAVAVTPAHATPSTNATAPANKLDLLVGAEAIADYLNIDVRQCFHWLQNNYIPASKTGNIWTATRSALRAHFSGSRRAAQ
jgi:hypothetical protein